ncbi:MAG: PilZ domain-containing protein [Spirochaetes bacterium]|nr:PilZ domain-containing protein [Spirochaetota bacterium]
MKIELEEIIEISPKLILWNKLPKLIDEEMIINFLKNDVLLLEYDSIENISKINAYLIAYVFNLDTMLFSMDNENQSVSSKAKEIIGKINSIGKYQKIAFTSHEFKEFKEMFFKAGIEYYQLKENSRKEIFDIVKMFISPIHISKYCRTNLRLYFKPNFYKALLIYKDNSFKGHIKDLSLSGMGITIDNNDDFKNCDIGCFLTIRVDFGVSFLVIANGMIVRKDKKDGLIGINIDIRDKFMIDENNAVMLHNIINTWIIKLVQSNCININNKELFD